VLTIGLFLMWLKIIAYNKEIKQIIKQEENMTTIEQLKPWAQEKINAFPVLQEDIEDLITLALDEIDQGESQSNEVYLAQDSIEQLIYDYIAEKGI